MKLPLYLLASALLLVRPARAQTGYDFLTVVEVESQFSSTAKLLFAPAFQGKQQCRWRNFLLPAARLRPPTSTI